MVFADLYANLEIIDLDKTATTVTVTGIGRWEKEFFQEPQDGSLTFIQRQQNLLAKIRASGGISLPAISSIIHAILDPVGLTFDILPFNGCSNPALTGAWILEVSSLDFDTYLGLMDPLLGAGRDPGITPLDCSLDYAAAGLTLQEMRDIQATAYTYAVIIHGTADAATLALLDRKLTESEPARSTHVIINNAPDPIPTDGLDLGDFTGDSLIDVIDCGEFNEPSPSFDILDFGTFV